MSIARKELFGKSMEELGRLPSNYFTGKVTYMPPLKYEEDNGHWKNEPEMYKRWDEGESSNLVQSIRIIAKRCRQENGRSF